MRYISGLLLIAFVTQCLQLRRVLTSAGAAHVLKFERAVGRAAFARALVATRMAGKELVEAGAAVWLAG